MNMQEAVSENSKISFSISARPIWSMLGCIIVCGLGCLLAVHYLIPGFIEIEISAKDLTTISPFKLMRLALIPVTSYIIIGTGMSLFINIFKKLKGFNEDGLVRGLVVCFFTSTLVGLIGGILGGFFIILFGGNIDDFTVFLFSIFIASPAIGLFTVLFQTEFK